VIVKSRPTLLKYAVIGPTVCELLTVQDVPDPAVISVPAETPVPVTAWPMAIVPVTVPAIVKAVPLMDTVVADAPVTPD
jgi:hypothetical protein